MKKVLLIATLIAGPAFAEVKYYTEYKNTLGLEGTSYLDDTALNDMRVGVQGDIFYLEAGAVDFNNQYGSGLETGYKYDFTSNWQIKGKYEARQIDTFESDFLGKFETEVRYTFNP